MTDNQRIQVNLKLEDLVTASFDHSEIYNFDMLINATAHTLRSPPSHYREVGGSMISLILHVIATPLLIALILLIFAWALNRSNGPSD